MDYQHTENQIGAQVLLFMVYQPMVANKTARFPLSQIVNQLPANERARIKQGIDALVEMSIFVIDGNDICITNKSEALFQGLNHIAGKPADAVEDMLKKSPAFSSALATINSDSRFTPPPAASPTVPLGNSTPKTIPVAETESTGLGSKIVIGIFVAIVLLGLMKLIFRY